MTAKKTLLNWLAQNDFQRVLKGLDLLETQYKDEQLRNDVTFQSGRLTALEQQRAEDTISAEDDRLQTAKIRQALLLIVNGLSENWTAEGIENIPSTLPIISKTNWKKYAAYIAAAIAVLASIAEFSGYSVRNLFVKQEVKEQPVSPPAPSQKVSTSGDNSPAVITEDGDVIINYGETKSKKDSVTKK